MLNTSVNGPSGRGADAQQNTWMLKSAKFVLAKIRPKVYWGENAPGLFSTMGDSLVTRMKALATRYGYTFSMVKTNTNLHGLPQLRRRTFYFFWRSTTVPFLNYVRKKSPHLQVYLQSIPEFATHQEVPIVEGRITDKIQILLRDGSSDQ